MKTTQAPLFASVILPGFIGIITADEPKSHTVPFRLHGGHMIVVTGRIGEIGDLNFLIDTGAEHLILYQRRVEGRVAMRRTGERIQIR